jgi:hypothetical protein
VWLGCIPPISIAFLTPDLPRPCPVDAPAATTAMGFTSLSMPKCGLNHHQDKPGRRASPPSEGSTRRAGGTRECPTTVVARPKRPLTRTAPCNVLRNSPPPDGLGCHGRTHGRWSGLMGSTMRHSESNVAKQPDANESHAAARAP